MSASLCHVVELALSPRTFPDRLAWTELLARLPLLGTVKCIEVAIAPDGGGRLSFVVHDALFPSSMRESLRELVGDEAIMLCTPRPA
jgi:hypothetical protein